MNHPATFLRIPLALLLLVLPACRTSTPPPADPIDETPVELPPSPALFDDTLPDDSLPGATILPPDLPDAPDSTPAPVPLSRLYILRWNPDISSFTADTFREGFARLRTEGDARTNWSIHDWQTVSPGDWALFVRVGGGDTDGIAGLCRFLSPAYEGASWRGDGSTVHYADIDILLLNDPARSGLFAAAELAAAFPSVDWHGGHSGVLLDTATAEPLALHLADRLAHLDDASLPSEAFAVAPLARDGPRAIVCALLSHLCPGFKHDLAALSSVPDWDLWFPEPGIDIVYTPARLAPDQTLLGTAIQIDPSDAANPYPAFTPDAAAFAADLLAAAAAPGENAIVSPLAADTLLSALALGTRGAALDGLLDLFGPVGGADFWKDRIRLNNFILLRNHILLQRAVAPDLYDLPAPLPQYAADAGPDIRPASAGLSTRLFFHTLDGLSPGYADLCRIDALDIPLQPAPPGIDFPGPPGNPITAINNLDFRARWQTPFAPADTLPSVFHSPTGDVQVPFMNRFGDIAVKKLPGTRWIAFTLPYAGCDLELLLLLPPRDATPDDLRTGLADALSAEWYTPAQPPTPAFLTMPRITFPADAPDLVPALLTFGLGALCEPGTTDLSPINPDSLPYLRSVCQSLPFTVTEAGTAPFPDLPSAEDAPPSSSAKSQRLLLNRPFAFALRDTPTGLLLLLGQFFIP